MRIVKQDYNILKFHLLDHVVEDLKKFRSLDVLNSFPFECYNVHIKKANHDTSQQGTR